MLSLRLPIALAQDEAAPLESRAAAAAPEATLVEPTPPGATSGFRFLGLAQTKLAMTSLSTTNPFLDGQVVGTIGGTNGTTTSADERALYTEQRVSGFFSYAPPVLDGCVALTAGFEVDFGWGDQSYSTGGNVGGAFGGDGVNLQTRRMHGTFKPRMPTGHKLTVITGLQLVADGAVDPSAARPDDLFRGGGKLMFFGSEAAGVSAFGAWERDGWTRARYRLGGYTLYEEALPYADDVTLWMVDGGFHPAVATWVTGHFWHLRDRAGGSGGGLLGAGPTSALAELQGAARLDLRPDGEGVQPEVDADLVWAGVDVGYNHDLSQGPLGLTALAVLNAGRLYVTDLPDLSVLGWVADAEARLRYAPGAGSVARVEVLASSADQDGDDAYTGVITGNSYGVVGAVYASHGTLLLFPDPLSINRQVSVVYDASGAGDGVLGVTGGVGYDVVPNRVTATVGGGHARSGDVAATEVNARLSTHPWLLANLNLAGGAVLGTDLPATPWIAVLYLDWLVF